MKKLFYIVLVIVILLVIGQFVKQETAAPMPDEEIVVVEEGVIHDEVLNDGEVIEEDAEDVVESNPETTADEDETIIQE